MEVIIRCAFAHCCSTLLVRTGHFFGLPLCATLSWFRLVSCPYQLNTCVASLRAGSGNYYLVRLRALSVHSACAHIFSALALCAMTSWFRLVSCPYQLNTSILLAHRGCRRRRLYLPGLPCFWCSVCLLLPCARCRRGEPDA